MTKQNQELLLEIAGECGFEAEAMSDYSGRGMYGRTTDAVVVLGIDQVLAGFLMGILVERTGQQQLVPFRTDHMGKDGTVLY